MSKSSKSGTQGAREWGTLGIKENPEAARVFSSKTAWEVGSGGTGWALTPSREFAEYIVGASYSNAELETYYREKKWPALVELEDKVAFLERELNNFRRNAAHRAEQLAEEKVRAAESRLAAVEKAAMEGLSDERVAMGTVGSGALDDEEVAIACQTLLSVRSFFALTSSDAATGETGTLRKVDAKTEPNAQMVRYEGLIQKLADELVVVLGDMLGEGKDGWECVCCGVCEYEKDAIVHTADCLITEARSLKEKP